jgi:transcriptional regulator GlxA family with amidase domain
MGVSPEAYHRTLRLDAARESLRRSDQSVALAALEHGFSSSQHFSSAFRQTFGMTPRQWTREVR